MTIDDHQLAAAYALDAASPTELAAFESHLRSCPSCAEEVVGFRLTAARLGSVALVPPPAELRERILSLAARTPQERPGEVVRLVPHARGRDRRGLRGGNSRWLAAAAAVLLVAAAGLGISNYAAVQRTHELTASAAAVAEVLNAPDVESVRGPIAGGGSGSIVVSRERGQAVVVTSGLGPAPAGMAYQLWALGDKQPRSRGLLDPTTPAGTAGEVIAWPTDATTFGMTVEPSGGSTQPTTDPILLLDLPT